MTDQLDDPIENEKKKGEINKSTRKKEQTPKIANREKIHLPLPSPDEIIYSRKDHIKDKNNQSPPSAAAYNPPSDLIK